MMAAASGADPTPVRSSRWLKIALVASLAVNLLVVGTIGGSLWAFRNGPRDGHGVNAHLIGFTSTLSAQRRYAIWQATRDERRALRPLRKEVRAARADARAILTTEPFDKEKFSAAQARVLAAEIKARGEAHKLFIAVAALLTPEERAAFARWEPVRRAERMRLLRHGQPDEPTKATAAPAQPR